MAASNPLKHILLIEDEVTMAELYARGLESSGFNVVRRYDGDTGLAEAQTKPYDLILLDLMLPNKSGMEVLRALRDPAASPKFNQKTEIIILTNFEEDDKTKQEMLRMAKAYLLKVDITPHSLAKMLLDMGTASAASAKS